MHEPSKAEVVWQGRHTQMMKCGRWEYVTRPVSPRAVGIVALTNTGALVLIEQYRPPMRSRVIELPAGLVGDVAGHEGESPLTAAKRELLEETGYAAGSLTVLFEACSSPGLTDEQVTFFLARGLVKAGDGGGDDSEDIAVHEVPLSDADRWIAERQHDGLAVDVKVFAALHFLGDVRG